jgi:2,4-dienoyl-CoA reductase-like NADH-dependent reductase (Old Yellow Enzyme family)
MQTPMRNIGRIQDAASLLRYFESLDLELPFDEEVRSGPDSPLAQPLTLHGRTIGNRFAILPMEGWDCTTDGRPTDLTRRRWQRWGLSGAKLIFGAEAIAVCPEGRGSPSQLIMLEETLSDISALRDLLVDAHARHFSSVDDLLVGVQLTHSGRVAHPHDMGRPEPRTLYHHPLLDARYDAQADSALMTDGEIERVIADFVRAARLAQRAGFDFVDIKHCHGYLGHEFLSAVDRPGRYGGSFENRTRFLQEVVAGIRAEAPGLEIAVRFSAVDFVPFEDGDDDRPRPALVGGADYPYAFGGDGTGLGTDLAEPLAFLDLLAGLDIGLVSASGGAEYNSHVMEPYVSLPVAPHRPPEDPLVGVARLVSVVAELKKARPGLVHVGSGYSYLQQWLPNVAQAAVAQGWADTIGIGRMALSYPDIVADILDGRPLQSERICNACSWCDIAPGFGEVSGCYTLDGFYRDQAGYERLKRAVKAAREPA